MGTQLNEGQQEEAEQRRRFVQLVKVSFFIQFLICDGRSFSLPVFSWKPARYWVHQMSRSKEEDAGASGKSLDFILSLLWVSTSHEIKSQRERGWKWKSRSFACCQWKSKNGEHVKSWSFEVSSFLSFALFSFGCITGLNDETKVKLSRETSKREGAMQWIEITRKSREEERVASHRANGYKVRYLDSERWWWLSPVIRVSAGRKRFVTVTLDHDVFLLSSPLHLCRCSPAQERYLRVEEEERRREGGK